MSNLRFSTFFLESMGMSKKEANLSLKRNSEFGPQPILTSDTRMMHEQRYSGLSEMDKAHAEKFNSEFGHLNNCDRNGRIKF